MGFKTVCMLALVLLTLSACSPEPQASEDIPEQDEEGVVPKENEGIFTETITYEGFGEGAYASGSSAVLKKNKVTKSARIDMTVTLTEEEIQGGTAMDPGMAMDVLVEPILCGMFGQIFFGKRANIEHQFLTTWREVYEEDGERVNPLSKDLEDYDLGEGTITVLSPEGEEIGGCTMTDDEDVVRVSFYD